MSDNPKWHLNIRGKIAIGYIMVLLLLGLFLVIITGRIKEIERETSFLYSHDMEVRQLTHQIEKNVLDMETGQRGYALIGNSDYLEPYNEGLSQWKLNFSKLDSLISTEPEQQQTIDNIRADIEKWIEVAGQYVVDLKRNGQEDDVERFFRRDRGKELVDSIRLQAQAFRDAEQKLIVSRINRLEQNNRLLVITMYVLWAGVAAAALLASSTISRGITRTLNQVTDAIRGIAEGGKLSDRIQVNTEDEIKQLARSTNLLLEKVERDHWASEQVNGMAMEIQDKTELASLGQAFLKKLSAVVEMQYGAVYGLRDNVLVRFGLFGGAPEESEWNRTLRRGEGLAGQCIEDMRTVILEQVPSGYIKIRSSLGESQPRFIIVAPVLFENQIAGVVEIASLTKWDESQISLFHRLVDMLGVTLHSVTIKSEIQRLYNESQTMNEELQVQSEELRVVTEDLQNQQKELLITNEELEAQKSMAEQTAAELERYNVQLEESSRYKSEFLANMSHELRTPLNSLLILSQILAENRSGRLSEEEVGFAEVIHNSGSDLLSIINDILDLSKVEAGKMQVEMDAVNLTELPSVMTGYFGKTAESKKLDFEVTIGREVPDLFYTDAMRLHQILRNLLSNAFKFTESGGVQLAVNRLDSVNLPDYRYEGPVLAFAVKDTGIGISEENRQLIFEAFQQADGSTARKFGGTGLGLSISLQLARLLGGTISLSSTIHEGSTFTLYLPCREDDGEEEPEPDAYPAVEEAQAAAASEQPVPGIVSFSGSYPGPAVDNSLSASSGLANRTVLAVDDDYRNILALTKGLEPMGIHVLSAANGFECIRIVRERSDIDLVLLDIMMPKLDGYDTLSIIREDLGNKELPVIMLSAKSSSDERERAMKAGANGFVSKPVSLKELTGKLAECLPKEEAV